MLKGATLCSGIGAPECAAPDIDWLWSSDIEPFPNAVRAVRFPESVNLGDMTAEDFVERAAAIGLPDVLVAGTPCQAFSVAGLRQSLSDDRGNLTLLFVRICDAIDDLRRAAGLDPLWVVWENVPGVLSTSDNAFGSFLAGLGGHDAPIVPARGHRWSNSGVVAGPERTIAWRVLDAQYFGVPQRRRRVFAIARGGAGNWHGADALLPITESLQWHPAPSRKARKEVARGARGSIEGNRGAGWPADIACTLDTDFASKWGQNNQHINSGCPLFVPDIANSLGASPACGTSVNVANGQGTVIAVDTYNASVGDVAPALCTQGDHASGNGAVMHAPHPAVRRLTPRECERLQGFPDDWTAITIKDKPAADAPRYKALGNSMAVPVMRYILDRVKEINEQPLE